MLGSHTSNSSGALSDMGSTRAITQAGENGRTGSRGSSRGDGSGPYYQGDGDKDGMGGRGSGVGEIERKRTTHLIIEGPGYHNNAQLKDLDNILGHDLADGRRIPPFHTVHSGYTTDDRDLERGYNSFSDSDSHDDDDDGSEIDLDLELAAWPRGIIKTVSVEVVEEVNEEYVTAVAAAAAAANAKTNPNPGENPGSRGSGGATGVGNSTKGIGRNSVTVAPRVGGRGGGDRDGDRLSGGSGMEQDWEAMLRAGPPR